MPYLSPRLFVLIVATTSLAVADPARSVAQEPGDRVVIRRSGVELDLPGRDGPRLKRGAVLVVQRTRGPWLWVEEPERGWVHRQDVLTADAAVQEYFNYGVKSFQLAKYDYAIGYFEAVLEIDPAHALAHNNLAWILAVAPDADLRNPSQALEHAKAAVRLTSERSYRAFDTLAAAQAALGQFAQAVESQAQAIELAPDSEKELLKLRLELYQQGKPFTMPAPDARVLRAAM